MKIVENVTPLKVDSDRNLFTKHELHMNRKGKEQAEKKIVSTINYIFFFGGGGGKRRRENKQREDPISMTWKEERRDIEIQENHFRYDNQIQF